MNEWGGIERNWGTRTGGVPSAAAAGTARKPVGILFCSSKFLSGGYGAVIMILRGV